MLPTGHVTGMVRVWTTVTVSVQQEESCFPTSPLQRRRAFPRPVHPPLPTRGSALLLRLPAVQDSTSLAYSPRQSTPAFDPFATAEAAHTAPPQRVEHRGRAR